MINLLVGNLYVVTSMRCHNSWASQLNYLVTFISIFLAASMTPNFNESGSAIFAAGTFISIYEGVEKNSLAMFGALLDLESTKRVQIGDMKHFIGNVAHDLKVSWFCLSVC
jgi:hypothetical protein